MNVAIVTESLRQYRVPFYELLKSRLEATGVDLRLIYGAPDPAEASKADAVDIDWGTRIRNRHIRFGGRTVTWQPCLGLVRDADLIIVEQASRHLVNYVLLAQQMLGRQKIAFWGHGRNFQDLRASRLGEAVKRQLSKRVHWWFAYNDLSADVVRSLGFPAERITSVQNAIDTTQLTKWREDLTQQDLVAVRRSLGITGTNTCVFAGALYKAKRLDYLVSVGDLLAARLPDFELLVVGDGPERPYLEAEARTRRWLHVLGPRFDEQKVSALALGRLLLIPGLVGLAVLDAFALELPLIAVAGQQHSPEIYYLRAGVNGLLLGHEATPKDYAEAVVGLLTNEPERQKLVEGCRDSRDKYTIEGMVERFASGIESALSLGR